MPFFFTHFPLHFLLLSAYLPCLSKYRMMQHIRFTNLSFYGSTYSTHWLSVTP
jgi:hypothetical protein